MNIKETEHANINPARFLSFRREPIRQNSVWTKCDISKFHTFMHVPNNIQSDSRREGGCLQSERTYSDRRRTVSTVFWGRWGFQPVLRMACEAGALCPFSTLRAVSSAPLTAGSARPSHSSQTQQPMGGCLSILNPPPSDPITEVTKSKGPGLFVSGNDWVIFFTRSRSFKW